MNPLTPSRLRVSDAVKSTRAGAKSQGRRSPTPHARRVAASRAVSAAPMPADVVGAVLAVPRRNAEALVAAACVSYAGFEAVLQRHQDMLRETQAELHTVGRVMREVGMRESARQLGQLARGAVELTRVSVRELAGLATATQRDALQLLATRLRDDMAAIWRLRSA